MTTASNVHTGFEEPSSATEGVPSLLVERDGAQLTLRVLDVHPDSCTSNEGPAHLRVNRKGSQLTIRVLQVEADSETSGLQYELTVDRSGTSNSRTRQTGIFASGGALPDTLSTTRITVQPGDHVSLGLVIRRGNHVIDTICRDEVLSSTE